MGHKGITKQPDIPQNQPPLLDEGKEKPTLLKSVVSTIAGIKGKITHILEENRSAKIDELMEDVGIARGSLGLLKGREINVYYTKEQIQKSIIELFEEIVDLLRFAKDDVCKNWDNWILLTEGEEEIGNILNAYKSGARIIKEQRDIKIDLNVIERILNNVEQFVKNHERDHAIKKGGGGIHEEVSAPHSHK